MAVSLHGGDQLGPSSTAATVQTLSGRCQLGSADLGSAPSTAGTTTAATAAAPGLAGEATTAAALAAGPGRLKSATATTTASTSASSVVVGTTICVGLGAALLNHNVLAVHNVRVGGHSGLVSSRGLELDESAVLDKGQLDVRHIQDCGLIPSHG
jgi:hypothetical protein